MSTPAEQNAPSLLLQGMQQFRCPECGETQEHKSGCTIYTKLMMGLANAPTPESMLAGCGAAFPWGMIKMSYAAPVPEPASLTLCQRIKRWFR